jgi:hypothetical protein
VEGPDGSTIEGNIEVRDHETSWTFEVDVLTQVQQRVETPVMKLDFQPLK